MDITLKTATEAAIILRQKQLLTAKDDVATKLSCEIKNLQTNLNTFELMDPELIVTDDLDIGELIGKIAALQPGEAIAIDTLYKQSVEGEPFYPPIL